MAWLVLLVSGVLETVWVAALSRSEGFSRLVPSIVFVVALVLSMAGLAYALREIPVGTGYAVWVWLGAVVAGVVGLKFLH
ncbi:MAG TPA: SMR family transporter [Nitriliruptorales bacterium]|nr:SMR family transporter [Nitriliruptorales bacterium]